MAPLAARNDETALTTEDPRVRCDVDGPVATVTLTRPDKLNAQTPATWLALRDIGRTLPGAVRVVVVKGEGRSFSAGLDRSMFDPAAIVDLANEETIEQLQAGFTWLGRPDIVSVAAVQGHAIGAGFQLALACDLRIAAADASFAMAETSLGLVPDLSGTRILVEAVGYARAVEICLTGRQVGVDEAARLGLVQLVVPRAELEAATSDLVAAVLAAPRDAAIETKALLAAALRRSPAEQLAAERQAQVRRLRDLAGVGE